MSAIISPCGLYRYRLERDVLLDGKVVAFFGINPSTADANFDDATVRKWRGFCKVNGWRRFIVGNVFAYRATDVKKLASIKSWEHNERENWRHLEAIIAEADVLVPCWGDRKKVPRDLHRDIDRLFAWLPQHGKPVMHFGLTASGDPKHPLMLGYDTKLERVA